MYLIGYDLGSTTVKTALIDASTQRVLSVVQYPDADMDIIARQKGWAEQQPEIWWRNVCQGTKRLLSQNNISAKDIKGIGIAYQMHGLVMVDKDYQVLRPSIIWCDSRAVSIGDQAFKDIGQEYCIKNYLNSPGNFTASKLKWVKDNEPDIYKKIYKIMLPGDYIAMKMTGKISTTISGLSEGVFWDFNNKTLAKNLLNYFSIDENILAEPSPTFSILGTVNQQASIETGLALDTPVSYRAGDQPNNALALNVLNPGEIAATSGTSGVVYGIVDRPVYDEQSRVNTFAHVNYEENFDRMGMLLCINGAGMQYSWIKQQIARSGTNYSDMERMVSSVPVGSEGICILPFGNGSERIFNNKNLESHIYNVEFNRHSRAHIYRASLEGVAFSFVYGINMLKELGLDVDVIRVGNDNMFQSKVFSTTIATLLGNHIEVVDTTGAIGAARGAGVGIGFYNSVEEATKGVSPVEICEPEFNFGMCSQAYNYWLANLNRLLNQTRDNTSFVRNMRVQNNNLKEEIRDKNKLITRQSIQLDSKNKLLHKLSKELKELQSQSSNSNTSKRLDQINHLLKSVADPESNWDVFEEHFNSLNDDFLKRLKEDFPTLTFEELKMSTFLKMRMSSKEIASKLNLSIRGVETKRYRLRKKLMVPKGKKLIEILDNI